MVLKDIKGGICNPIQRYTTANKKIHKILFLKAKDRHILNIGM